MEVDWIRPSSFSWINNLFKVTQFDFIIGSIHHVHTIPIDFDRETYLEARLKSGGTDERLYEDYFDLQHEMLQALKPPIVGHFDLIRLKSDEPNSDFLTWPGVFQKVLRNLELIVEYGGILELNSAALRKGMNEPYPTKAVCKVSPAHEDIISSFDPHSSCSLPTEVDLLFRMIAMTLHRLGPITGSFYILLKIRVLLLLNASGKDRFQEIVGFQWLFLVLLVSSILKRTNFSIIDCF